MVAMNNGMFPPTGPGKQMGAQSLMAALANPQSAPRPVIKQETARSDALAKALLAGAMQGGNIETPTELLGRLAQTFSGNMIQNRNEQAEKAKAEAEKQAQLDRYRQIAEGFANGQDPATIPGVWEDPELAKSIIQSKMTGAKKPGRVVINGRLVDEATGEEIANYPPQEPAQKTVRPATPEEKAAYGVGPDTPLVIGPDGPKILSAGGTTINNNMGEDGSRLPPPPAGMVYATKPGPDGKPVVAMEPDADGKFLRPRLIPIAGSKADAEAASGKAAETTSLEQQAGKAETMLSSVTDIRKEFKDANTPVTGTLSRPFAMYSGTPAGRVRSYVGALKSGVAMNALLKLKQASSTGASGFGALSQNELQLLLDEVGTLNPDTAEPDIFLKTIDRIEQRYQRVLDEVRKTVPPEKIKEWGLESFVGGGGASPPGVGGTLPAPPPMGNDIYAPPPAVYEWTPDSGLRPAK